jgi:hypothetical protein
MSAADLLADLTRRGFCLEPRRGGSIFVRPPRGALTDQLRQRIRDQRAELLALLGACPKCGHAPFDQRQRCCWRCHWRACSRCGRATDSAFLELCLGCDLGGEVPARES